MQLLVSIVLLSVVKVSLSLNIRGSILGRQEVSNAYYTTSDANILGAANPDVAVGNPMKGLLTSPRWTGFNTPETIPSTLEFYYFGLDEIMTGPNQFDWTVMDDSLTSAAASYKHAIWRVVCHYPGQPLHLPQYLIDEIELVTIEGGEKSPQYDDPILLDAFEQFIAAWGDRYDGHESLAVVQLGLLGKWGEWHTYPETGLLSEEPKSTVLGWFNAAFQQTQLESRDPSSLAAEFGIGLHDDSFGFSTLDGAPNGGVAVDWYFWPKVLAAKQTESWRTAMTGGETRPELQAEIFLPSYNAGTEYKQDFMECTEVTHATYMLHHRAFQDGNPLTGTELENHLHAHARLGYNFRVSKVAAVATTSGFNTITVEVTVEQIGVAPFYYPLNLVLSCDGTLETADGVEDIIAPGDSKVFRFTRIPTDESCLDNIEIKLDSMFLYPERPMKFAQGSDGRVSFSLPPPPMESQEEGGNDPEIEDPFVDGEPSIEDNQKANAEEGNGDETDPVISTKIFVNAGTEDEDTSIVTGSFWINFDNSIKITNAGSYGEDVFKTHRWGESFTYTFSNLEPGSLKEITLGFAETYEPVCVEGARVMEISINDQVFIEELDVFAKAGCNSAYVAVGAALVNGEGDIDITFLGLTENAMVSFIEINPFTGR